MGKVIKEIIQWGRRRQQWLVRRIHNLTIRQRIICACVAVVLVLAAIIPTVQYLLESYRHTLDDATLKLVGKSNPNLASKLTYDQQNAQWQFNKAAITDTSSKSTDPAKNIPAALKAQLGGGGKDDDSMYAINFPTDPKKGVTFYDSQTGLSFTMTPQFKIHGGKATKDNRIVYPMAGGGQLIYTPKNNGMKEDIVLPKFIGKELAFSYKLDLPDTLSARVQADGSIGVFSIDPSLLGNVSTSNDTDAEKLKSARESAEKNHLLFAIPAPVIVQTGDKEVKATARFGLADGVLTVTARDMDTVQYPVSVDPSVVVTSSSDFQLGGNNDDNINFDTDQISRTQSSGGSIGNWSATTSLPTGTREGATVAYNNYIYIVGGKDASGSSSSANRVYYAAINTDGTVGAWSPTSSIPNYPYEHSLVAYNGYLYSYGGWGTTGLQSSVYYAAINSNGTLGTWSLTSSMNQGRKMFAAAAYNGILYAFGGDISTTSAGETGSNTTSVEYAFIKADGSLGAWTTTTSMPIGSACGQGTIYNGKIYYSDSACTVGTIYAQINSDGSVGNWSSLGAINPQCDDCRMVAYGGYLYTIAGWAQMANDGGVHYSAIWANGTIDTFRSTNSVGIGEPANRLYREMSAVAYKGRLYALGGTYGGDSTSVRYVTINQAGATTPFTTSSNTFTNTRRGSQTVVYNNYIYVMGGDNGGTPVNTVSFAPINADGTIGAFTNTTGFTTVRTYFAAVAYNGYLYVIGGCSSAYSSCTTASNNLNTIYRALINSDGTVGTWINTNTQVLPTARYGITAVVFNNYLYVMGGLNGSTFSNVIYYNAIDPDYNNTNDGRLPNAWSTSSRTLPASMAYMQATVYGGRLYVAGGCSAGALTCTTTRNTVHYAGIDANGELSAALASTSAFTTARGDFGLTSVNGRLYITGGRTNTTYYSDLQSAAVNSDGTLGSWGGHSGSTLATTRYGIGIVAAKSTIYVTGGYNGSTYYNNVQYAAVNNNGTGNIGTWTEDTVGTIGTARTENQTVAYNGYLYVLGGRNSGGTGLNSVEYAPLNNDGSVGTWQTTSSFTNARVTFAAAAQNDYMYILGGRNPSSSTYYKDIQYAKINTDGSLGTWASAGTDVYNGGQGVCMVVHNGYIYSLGGWDGSIHHVSVRYALQNSNGTIGTWQTAPDFTRARSNIQCMAYGGYIYVSGGEGNLGNNDVQYATLNANGSIGSWQYTNGYNSGRANHGMVAYNGYMYVIGGVKSTSLNTSLGDAQYAPINPNGTLGVWQHTTSPGTYYYADIVAYNGYIYLPAQDNGTYLATTRSAPLSTIARIGHYSKVVDIGEINKFTGITYGGTLPGGTLQINYRTAGTDGVFGSSYNVGRPPSPEGPCIGTYGTGRYIWISLTLDDTSGITSNITDITAIYESIHPATNIRLHGGKTLQSGTLSALDTCGIYS